MVTRILAESDSLVAFYSDIGRPSITIRSDMIRMLIVGYCYGIRSERRLCTKRSIFTLLYTGGAKSPRSDRLSVPRSLDVLGQSPWPLP